MTQRPIFLTRAVGLVPFGVGLAMLTLAYRWTTDVLSRSWLGPLLLVALLLAPLVWPLTSILVGYRETGISRLGLVAGRWLAERRMKRSRTIVKRVVLYDERVQDLEQLLSGPSRGETAYEKDEDDVGVRRQIEALMRRRSELSIASERERWLNARLGSYRQATALADVLAGAEESWRRYNYDGPTMMPRMSEILPGPLSRELQRDYRFTVAWASTAAGAALIVPSAIALAFPFHTWLRLTIDIVIAVYGAVTARQAYRLAVGTAFGYGRRLDAAIDLYRFKLLEQLHLPLPSSGQDEVSRAAGISHLLNQGPQGEHDDITFTHPADIDEAAQAQRVADIVSSAVPGALSASIEEVLSGPKLTQFTGRIGTKVIPSDAGKHWRLIVAIGAEELPFDDGHSEPLVVSGIAAAEAVFTVLPESDTLNVEPTRAVLRTKGKRSSQANFELQPLTDVAEHHLWLNVMQNTELVQVISVTLPG